jgi:eukaryotic-like serine/threonine-protein kinase
MGRASRLTRFTLARRHIRRHISAGRHSHEGTRLKDLVFEQLQVALAGRYVPQRALGHGAMATVYLATDLKHERDVAIKALRVANDDPAASERFQREIKFLAHLQHPHILPLFDSGDALGVLYYVSAYVEGDTLRQRMRKAPDRRLPLDEALRLAREIADALDYAHARNILHRDIKPENILLNDEHALVADFGIARAIQLAGEVALTDTGVAIGTPAYMSPEQLAADRQLDARSDVYSLACVVYEMLAGVQPFVGVRGVVDNAQKFVGMPALLSSVRDDISAQIENATRRALSGDPADRYGSAGEFIESLENRGSHIDGA